MNSRKALGLILAVRGEIKEAVEEVRTHCEQHGHLVVAAAEKFGGKLRKLLTKEEAAAAAK